MDLVPVPELLAALVVSASVLALRVAWRAGRAAWGRRVETAARHPTGDPEPEQIRARLVASCVLLVVISVPLILRLVPPNGMYGFRTEAARSTPAIWYQANAFMGWALSIAAIASTALLVLLPVTAKRWLLWAVFFGPLAAAIVLSFAYLHRL
jgi:SdpI/YhfL family protein